MKKRIIAVCAALAFGLLAACSGEGGTSFNPDQLEVTLATEPSPPAAGETAELRVQLAGVPPEMRTFVDLEIRAGEVPDLIKADNRGSGLFAGTYRFPQAGTYDVYLHLYVEDLHLIKKRQVQVQ